MKYRNYNIIFFVTVIVLLIIFALPTIIVDPLFHYHEPLPNISYKLNDQRYQNDGIVRHFEYDTLITGTSMVGNFRPSEADKLFGVNAIKVSYSGGTYKEISDNILVALENNPNLQIVIRGTDLSYLIMDKDTSYTDINPNNDYPGYLIDRNLFTDVNYIFNKEILINKTLDVLKFTKDGGQATTFDEYSFWENSQKYGKDVVLSTFVRPEKTKETKSLTNEEEQIVKGNIGKNVIEIALAYPDVEFYVFIPPYSICFWDCANQDGDVERMIAAMEVEIEELVKVDNVKLFAFGNRQDIVCNLDNYLDTVHYSAAINSEILRCMANEENMLTADNYQEYLRQIRELYLNYDYDSIYK